MFLLDTLSPELDHLVTGIVTDKGSLVFEKYI